jgi:hypothetical protein
MQILQLNVGNTHCGDSVADYLIKQIQAWSISGHQGLSDIFQAKRATPMKIDKNRDRIYLPLLSVVRVF